MAIDPSRPQISPWAVIVDDGQDIFTMDAYSWTRHRATFPDRDVFHRSLQGANTAYRDQLLHAGVLVTPDHATVATPPNPVTASSAPFLNTVTLDIDSAADQRGIIAQLKELRDVLRRVLASESATKRLVFRLRVNSTRLAHAADFMQALTDLARTEHVVPEALEWQICCSSLDGKEDFLRLIDRWRGVSIVVIDATETGAQDHGPDSPQGASVAELVEAGAVVRIQVPTLCPADLADRVRRWQECSDTAIISLHPVLLDSYEGRSTRFLDSPGDFSRALDILLDLGTSIDFLSIDPFRSILINSAIPGVARAGTSRRLAQAYLSQDCAWYRSRDHASCFLASAIDALIPAVHRARDRVCESLEHSRQQNLPHCHTCPLEPLCDGYWSPEMDLLLRTGEIDRAGRLAAFSCQLRTQALQALLRQEQSDHRRASSSLSADRDRTTTRVLFSKGQVAYVEAQKQS